MIYNSININKPKSFLHRIFYIFFVKDPCKKCLVSPCCSVLCENKINYLSYCDIDGNINFMKFNSLCIIMSIINIIVAVIKFVIIDNI